MKKIVVILVLTQILLINTYHFCHENDLILSFEESRLAAGVDNDHHHHYSGDHSGVHNFLVNSSNLKDFSKLNCHIFSFIAVDPENHIDNFCYTSVNIVKIVPFDFVEHLPVYLENSSLLI